MCTWIANISDANLEHCFDIGNCWQLSRKLAEAADAFAATVADFTATDFTAASLLFPSGFTADFTTTARIGEQIACWAQTPGGAAAIAEITHVEIIAAANASVNAAAAVNAAARAAANAAAAVAATAI